MYDFLIEVLEAHEECEDNYAKILSSVCNSEAKCLVLAYGLGSDWKTVGYISSGAGVNVADGVWSPKPSGCKSYCEQSLIPIGLVAKKKVDQDSELERIIKSIKDENHKERLGRQGGWRYPVTFYKQSDLGETIGKYVAVFIIKKSKELGISFQTILGATSSKGKSRRPYNVAVVLERLYNSNNNLRKIDFRLSNDGIGTILLPALAKLGLITYKSINVENSSWGRRYEWVKSEKLNQVKTVNHYKTLTPQVAKAVFNTKNPVNREDIANIIKYQHKGIISTVLSGLKKQGIIKVAEDSKFKSREIHSITNLTDKGRLFYAEVLTPIKDFIRSEGTLDNVVWRAWDKMQDSKIRMDYCTQTIKYFVKVSSGLNRKTAKEREEDILKALENGPLRTKELKEKTGQTGNIYIARLFERGEIIRKPIMKNGKRTTGVKYWRKDVLDTRTMKFCNFLENILNVHINAY